MSCPLLFIGKLQLRFNEDFPGDAVMRTSPSSTGGVDSTPGKGAKTPHASRLKKKKQSIKEKQYGNKFNKDFLKNSSHQKKNFF